VRIWGRRESEKSGNGFVVRVTADDVKYLCPFTSPYGVRWMKGGSMDVNQPPSPRLHVSDPPSLHLLLMARSASLNFRTARRPCMHESSSSLSWKTTAEFDLARLAHATYSYFNLVAHSLQTWKWESPRVVSTWHRLILFNANLKSSRSHPIGARAKSQLAVCYLNIPYIPPYIRHSWFGVSHSDYLSTPCLWWLFQLQRAILAFSIPTTFVVFGGANYQENRTEFHSSNQTRFEPATILSLGLH